MQRRCRRGEERGWTPMIRVVIVDVNGCERLARMTAHLRGGSLAPADSERLVCEDSAGAIPVPAVEERGGAQVPSAGTEDTD